METLVTKKLESSKRHQKQDPTKREFLKKAAYSVPAILSLQATSAVAKSGSSKSAPTAKQRSKQQKAKQQKLKQQKQQQRRKRG